MTPRDEALQFIFDLMANKKIQLTISGEMGEVDGELKVQQWMEGHSVMASVADVIGAEDFESALIELVDKAVTRFGRKVEI